MANFSKEDMMKMMDFMKENPTTMDKEIMDKMYAAMDKAQRKEYMKSMIKDMKDHPEMIDDDMKTSMKDMAKLSAINEGINTMTEQAQNPAGSPGETAAELKTGGQADIKGLEAQLAKAMELKSQDVTVLTAQLEEVRKIKFNKMVVELESSKSKIAELEGTVKQYAAELAKRSHDGAVKELQRQIQALSETPVIHTTISAAMDGRRVSAQLDSDPEFAPVSVHDLE
jgi:uncharacterized tellurite resistance protein B-like protein